MKHRITVMALASMVVSGLARFVHDKDGEIYVTDSVIGGIWRFDGFDGKNSFYTHEGDEAHG